jgi:AcrR family transcriptional regulator
MRKRRGEVGKQRREQIVEAAVAVIAAEGLQKLSLSAIERKAGMSRGQLTYYFPAKEDILLAVFDRLLELLHRRAHGTDGCGAAVGNGASSAFCAATGWERLRQFLTFVLLTPPEAPEFHALQYTFLSQIGHREDFRARLASLYEEWRGHMAADLAEGLARRPGGPAVSPRTLATFVQALLHGLAMQRVADPGAYDRQEMLGLCLHVLDGVLRPGAAVNGARRRKARRPNEPSQVNHEQG